MGCKKLTYYESNTALGENWKIFVGGIEKSASGAKKCLNYYAFGSVMPNANNLNAAGHTYGFNGKMNDNELKGNGNSINYGFRIHDPRLGRFLSEDPLTQKFPMLTPYQYASNTPIWCIDLDGLEGVIAITVLHKPKGFNKALFAEQLKNRLVKNGAHPNTKVVFDEDYSFTEKLSDWWSGKYKDNQSAKLFIRDFNITFRDKPGSGQAALNSHTAVIYTGLSNFNPTKKSKPIPLCKFVNTAMHELGHAIYGFEHDDKGDTETGEGVMDYDHQFDDGADFDQFQQDIIWLRAQGIDASSGAAKGIIQNGAVIQGAVNGIVNSIKSIFQSAAPVREVYRSVRFL